MSVLSWRPSCAPRRSFLVVSSANQRSTRLSHDELVGVKCRTNRGWAASHRLIAGVLWVEALSSTRCTSRSAGTSASILQELAELDRAVAGVQRPDHLAGRDVERGVQARGAVADVVVAGPRGGAGQHREHRLGAVEGLDLGLLVHAQHQRPFGRVEVEPDDVADLVDEQRVFRQLPRSSLCGASPNARHTRDTVDWRHPQVRGHRPGRPVRRVRRCGLQGLGDQRLDRSSATMRGRPGRGSSTSPSRRCSANLLRHCPHRRPRPSRSATGIRAALGGGQHDPGRIARPAALVRRRAHDSNWARSSSDSAISADAAKAHPTLTTEEFLTQDTRPSHQLSI